MTDNTTLNTGTGGDVIATDDIGGVKYQRVKVTYGDDGAATDTSATNPLPVLVAGSVLEDSAHVSGDRGVYVLGVRQDADTSPVSADGDYHGLVFNAIGRLKVSVLPGATAASTGSITTAASTVVCDVQRQSNAVIMITGTHAGINMTFEASNDGGTTYFGIQAVRMDTGAIEATTGVITSNATRAWEVSANAMTHIRVRATAYTSGTGAITIQPGAFATEPIVTVAGSLPTGTNTIGAVNIASAQTLATVTTVSTLTNITNWGNVVDNAAFTDGTSRVSMSGYILDETAGTALTENDAAAARVDSKRAQVMVIEDVTTRGTTNRASVNTSLGLSVTPTPHTSGGVSVATGSIGATVTSIKASAGQVFGWYFYNPNASVAYVQFFNTASGSVTLGTTAPVYSLGIPASSAANVELSLGIAHSTAITIGITTTRAGSTGPGSTVDYNILYK